MNLSCEVLGLLCLSVYRLIDNKHIVWKLNANLKQNSVRLKIMYLLLYLGANVLTQLSLKLMQR